MTSLAYSPTGGLLAAAGDDEGIKLISTVDNSIVRILKGHDKPILSLAFDPRNEFLTSADSDGLVIYWDVATGKALHRLEGAALQTDVSCASRNCISWHPDGGYVAVPGHRNDIVMYDRDTAEEVHAFRGAHTADVGTVAWSTNGQYLASAGDDQQVVIWDNVTRKDLDSLTWESEVCGLSWSPEGNALAMIDMEGNLAIWDGVIPAHMVPPAHPGSLAEEELLSRSGDEHAPEKSETSKERKRHGGGSSKAGGDTFELPVENESDSDEAFTRLRKRQHKIEEEVSQGGESNRPTSANDLPKLTKDQMKLQKPPAGPSMQASFQSGSTTAKKGQKRFLAYNLLGCVTTREDESCSHIEVDLHDTSRGSRLPTLTDYFGFTMAALSRDGSLLANPSSGPKNPSMLMYRPFSSWASNSEWSMRLPQEEEVVAVALGSGWAAAGTNLHMLRLFTEAGLQHFVLSLAGPIVTMAGHEEKLAVVTHAGPPLASGDQVMNFVLYDMCKQQVVASDRLPLSRAATLAWLGFSEDGQLSTYDSQGILRMFCDGYGGCWVSVFSSSIERKCSSESHWVVGLSTSDVYCIVVPRPVLTTLPLRVPLVSSDLGAENIEEEYVRGSIQLLQARTQAESSGLSADEEDRLEDSVLKLEANLDRCLLRVFVSACKADRIVRALEVAKMLRLNKSLEGAIRLVANMRLPALAERLNAHLENKLRQEQTEGAELKTGFEKFTVPYPSLQTPPQSCNARLPTSTAAAVQTPTPASLQTLSSSHLDTPSGAPDNSLRGSRPEDLLPCGQAGHDRDEGAKEHRQVGTPAGIAAEECVSAKQSSLLSADVCRQAAPLRTSAKVSNPFAKVSQASSGPLSEGSLLDSVKRMQQLSPVAKRRQGKAT
eukprot:SM000079S22418  [mRNA]  locus=s79:8874:14531:- [translate_table: standard]